MRTFLEIIVGKIEFVSHWILIKEKKLEATGIPLVFFMASLIFSMLYLLINSILLEKLVLVYRTFTDRCTLHNTINVHVEILPKGPQKEQSLTRCVLAAHLKGSVSPEEFCISF